jgi:5-methylthioadenosine/S-adenosylhomocysteine deaminase
MAGIPIIMCLKMKRSLHVFQGLLSLCDQTYYTMTRFLIRGILITCDGANRIIYDGAVLVEDKIIRRVGKFDELIHEDGIEEVIGNSRSIVIPGLINTHTHLSMTLFKGILEGLTGMSWLKLAWSIESHLKADDVYAGARLGCVEMLKSGTTCFADHYFQMENVAKAVKETGIRGVLAEAVLDFGDRARGAELLKKGESFAEKWHGKANGRVQCMIGPHSTYTCTPDTLKLASDIARRLGIGTHLHVLEHREEASKVKRKYGKKPIELLESVGFLNKKVLAAHVTFASDEDLSVLKKRHVNVNVNVYCKMKGGQGIARIREMLDMGINVSLGTDGPASHNNLDMFEEMKLSIAATALRYRNPGALSAMQSIRMATINGARAIGQDAKIGSIEEGKEADMVVLQTASARATPLFNPAVMSAQTLCGNDVEHVIVQGRIVIRNKKLVDVNEGNITREAEARFGELMRRSGLQFYSENNMTA